MGRMKITHTGIEVEQMNPAFVAPINAFALEFIRVIAKLRGLDLDEVIRETPDRKLMEEVAERALMDFFRKMAN